MRIVHPTSDGGVAVTFPNEGIPIEQVVFRVVPPGSPYILVEDHAVPTDKTFRAAWDADFSNPPGGKGVITINMGKARHILRRRLRDERALLLAALDVEYNRADEAGDAKTKATIAAKKQALRDATENPAIEAAATPDELAKIVLGALI